MIRVALVTLAGLLLVPRPAGPGPRAAETGLPPEAARLERALDSVRSLRVDFVQIRDVAITGESVEASGFLAFRPPSDFRLAYEEPEVQELVITGDSLWVVMPSENQAQRYPFSPQDPGNEVFLLFGASTRKLTDVFTVVQEVWGGYETALRLVPRDAEPGYPLEEIRLVVGEEGFPRKLFFREVTGDTVIFSFTRITRNPESIDRLVRLVLPEGIEVIDVSPTRDRGGFPIDKDQ